MKKLIMVITAVAILTGVGAGVAVEKNKDVAIIPVGGTSTYAIIPVGGTVAQA